VADVGAGEQDARAERELAVATTFTGAPEQLWRIDQLADGSYRLMPKASADAKEPVALSAVGSQSVGPLRVVISDQSGADARDSAEVRAAIRYVEARGHHVDYRRHLPRRGMAEQRQFLLDSAQSHYALFLDDDVICEPDLVGRLVTAIDREGCGFVGSALIGLSYAADVRPHEQVIELWPGRVEPEQVRPGTPAWKRHVLHNAANLWHVQQRLGVRREEARVYKVAWLGGCVLYDVAKLRAAGGFEFWSQLPATHVGEDALAELRVMARFGGAGLIPSGAYHLELPTTLPERTVDAPLALEVA